MEVIWLSVCDLFTKGKLDRFKNVSQELILIFVCERRVEKVFDSKYKR